MEENLGDKVKESIFDGFRLMNKEWSMGDIRMLSSTQLAYIGDAVYELFIRTHILSKRNISVNELHKEAIQYVKAKSQAEIILSLEDRLTEEEWSFVKRGRNAKSTSVPKNANLIDYKYATGFEALIGYLYLSGQDKRILEIFRIIVSQQQG